MTTTASRTLREEPRFIADAMLGRLARWLRVLGYDTVYQAHIIDADLVRQARQEGRIILTRDRALSKEWGLADVLLVEATTPRMQLRQVVRQLNLPWRARLFSRCMLCNAVLHPIPPQEAARRVPPYVLQHQRNFVRCPTCSRIYWQGTHAARMRRQLHLLFLEGSGCP